MDDAMLSEHEARVEGAVAAHLLREAERVEEEFLQARAVQRFLLPAEVIQHERYRTAYVYHPFGHVGGDFLDVLQREDGVLVVMIGDVSGHGMAAALSSAMLKAEFVRHAGKANGPGDLLTRMDRDMRGAMRCGRFVTGLVMWVEVSSGAVRFASAGHPMPLLMREGKLETLEVETGYPLFTGEEAEYPETGVGCLRKGDRVLMLTDGILEAERSTGEMLSNEDLSRVVGSCAVDGDFAHCLFESLLFSDLVFKDDVSLMAVEWRGE